MSTVRSNRQKVFPEQCMHEVSNKFELVLLSSRRAKDISSGATTSLDDTDGEKPSVTAMREIATGAVSVDKLHQLTVESLQNKTSNSNAVDVFDQHYVDINAIPEDNESDAKRELQDLNYYDMEFDV